MSSVLSFAEESCWDGERFRSVRRQIVFTLTGRFATINSAVPVVDLRLEFTSDFGVFYDVDDDWLIELLKEKVPQIDWGRFVYWKAIDHSGIQIIDTDTDEEIGRIRPRGLQNPRIPADQLPEGVVSLSRWKESREKTSARCDSPEGC